MGMFRDRDEAGEALAAVLASRLARARAVVLAIPRGGVIIARPVAPAIVIDDGVATGATAIAALRWAGTQGATRVVFAAPVGPAASIPRLQSECDDVVLLETPLGFRAVGEWYRRFDQVTDREVL